MPEKTLADTLAANETLYVHCGHPACCKSTKLDVQALIDRLGADHGVDALGFGEPFSDARIARPAGRERRPVFFTCVPDYQRIQAANNMNWKPTFERATRQSHDREGPRGAALAASRSLSLLRS